MNTKKLVTLALYTVIALTVFILESMIPPLLPIPGMKLGLANVVTLVLLAFYRPGEVFCVLLVRILLGSIFGGQMMSLLYSLSGGVLCFFVMWPMNRFLGGRYLVLTSMSGAVAHNVGQIAAAYLILQSAGVLAYLPVLMISGLAAGCFTGLAAGYAVSHLKKIKHMDT